MKPSLGSALYAIIADTVQEARARWLFWGLFGLSSLLILIFMFALNIDLVQGAQATLEIGSKSRTIYDVRHFIDVTYSWVAAALYVWGTLLAIFASAGLVPVLLEPGRIALLLSKPLARPVLLGGRYLGNILIVVINHTYLVLAVWIILGYKSHVWEPRFLLAIPVSVFMFAVLLAIVFLSGVIFESAALSVMLAIATMLISTLLAQLDWADRLLSSDWSRQLWHALYWIVPKVFDLGASLHHAILLDHPAAWLAPLWTSAAFALILLTGATIIFEKRDF